MIGGEPYWRTIARRNREWRAILLPAQDGLCPTCGKPVHYLDETLDHVLALRLGGADRLGNVLVSHFDCNHDKGHRLPTGCELIWLLAVNARIGVLPDRW
jgi:5-methylcytosine-specific restriction endonuclease McrA